MGHLIRRFSSEGRWRNRGAHVALGRYAGPSALLRHRETRRRHAAHLSDTTPLDCCVRPSASRLGTLSEGFRLLDGADRTSSNVPRPARACVRLAVPAYGNKSFAARTCLWVSRHSLRKEDKMTTAESVRDLALSLARSGLEREDAVRELEGACEGRRVAVVRARQMIETSLDNGSEGSDAAGAIALLDDLIARLPA
jgi:hypothetical protein